MELYVWSNNTLKFCRLLTDCGFQVHNVGADWSVWQYETTENSNVKDFYTIWTLVISQFVFSSHFSFALCFIHLFQGRDPKQFRDCLKSCAMNCHGDSHPLWSWMTWMFWRGRTAAQTSFLWRHSTRIKSLKVIKNIRRVFVKHLKTYKGTESFQIVWCKADASKGCLKANLDFMFYLIFKHDESWIVKPR